MVRGGTGQCYYCFFGIQRHPYCIVTKKVKGRDEFTEGCLSLKLFLIMGLSLFYAIVTFKVKFTELEHVNHNGLSKLSKMSPLKFSLFFLNRKLLWILTECGRRG